jgi:hypothetical protein
MLPALALLALSSTADAAKVPATVNIGLGPTVAWVGNPGAGPITPSVGVALQAEGWVSKKTLNSRKVKRRVPKQYRGMLKGMPDAHVTPLPVMLIPDVVGLVPLPAEDATAPSAMPVSWSPLGISLVHKVKGPHVVFDLQPRVSWLRLEDAAGTKANTAWLGATVQPEVQTNMKKRVGVAVGGHVGGGWVPEPKATLQGYAMPWMHADGYARLQLRVPIEVDL